MIRTRHRVLQPRVARAEWPERLAPEREEPVLLRQARAEVVQLAAAAREARERVALPATTELDPAAHPGAGAAEQVQLVAVVQVAPARVAAPALVRAEWAEQVEQREQVRVFLLVRRIAVPMIRLNRIQVRAAAAFPMSTPTSIRSPTATTTLRTVGNGS